MNLLLIALPRNELGRVTEAGSVSVTGLGLDSFASKRSRFLAFFSTGIDLFIVVISDHLFVPDGISLISSNPDRKPKVKGIRRRAFRAPQHVLLMPGNDVQKISLIRYTAQDDRR